MRIKNGNGVLLPWIGLFVAVSLASVPSEVLADENRLPGEIPFANVKGERPHYLRLLSGKLFRVRRSENKIFLSESSSDEGKTWQRGGRVNPFTLGGKLRDVAIQIQSGRYKGRILVPFYLGMYGDHPDYTVYGRGGYGTWKGKKIIFETHTHIPEMSGTYVCYSDDEGKTWKSCVKKARGFLMGYFKDGHMGHMTCEEPVLAELKDGRLLCFMRSTCGRILKSYSEDGGEHWMKVLATDIAMSNSPCSLKRIPGRDDLVLVWNPMSAAEIRKGFRRGRLSIAISKDDGQTWENVKTLALSPGVEDRAWVEPPPLQAMVRGPSGRDKSMCEIPDGYTQYHYSNVFFSKDKIFINYNTVNPLTGVAGAVQWRVFPITWLYEPRKE